MKLSFFLTILLLSSLAKAGDLQVRAKATLWGIPVALNSCQAVKSASRAPPDIPPVTINFGNLEVMWKDPSQSVSLNSIAVTLRNPIIKGGVYKCTVDGAELEAMGSKGWTRISPAKDGVLVTTDCPLQCGNLQYKKQSPPDPVGMRGTLEVNGKTEAGVSVKAKLEITVNNI